MRRAAALARVATPASSRPVTPRLVAAPKTQSAKSSSRPTEYLGQARDEDELDKLLERGVDEKAPQIALVARSNAGKSSLVNSLLGSKLAIVSNMPGRTRAAQAFQTQGMVLIDLPGYGFARGSAGGEAEKMADVVADIALERERTDLVLLLMDSRRLGPMPSDERMIHALKAYDRRFEVVFTKVDSLNKQELESLRKFYPSSWFVSSRKGFGILELKNHLSSFIKR